MMSPLVITIIVLACTILLFIFTRLRADLIALMAMLALGFTGVVSAKDVFSGFSNSAVITIMAISMISFALQQTGVAFSIGEFINARSKSNETIQVLLIILFSAVLSLFMNNIAAAGVLLPSVLSLARRNHKSPSRLLIPLAYGTILGGMATLLTTSNIIASSALKDAGFKPFGLLDFFPIGAPVVVIGVLYMLFIGRKLLPNHKIADSNSDSINLSEKLTSRYQLDSHLSYLLVNPASSLVGKVISSSNWPPDFQGHILGILRKNRLISAPEENITVQPLDILLTQCDFSEEMVSSFQLTRLPADKINSPIVDEKNPIFEIMPSPHSNLIGKNLRDLNFRENFGISILSIWRQNKPLLSNISHISLQIGDLLLAKGSAHNIQKLKNSQDLILLQEDPDMIVHPDKQWIAVAITAITLVFSALGIFPVAQTIMLGAVLLLLTGCMSMTDAVHHVEWRAVFLIAGMWPLTVAIRETGLAESIVNYFLKLAVNPSPLLIIAIFLFFSMLVTQFLSGPVTPIILTPLAITAASSFNMDPRPLAMAVALGCSLAFITPLSHPVNILVMNPGGYTFKDYFKVGFPLTILSFFTILAGFHFIWGL